MHQILILFVRILAPALGVLMGLLGFATLGENLLGWFLFIGGIVYAAGAVITAYILRRNFWDSQATGLVTHAEASDHSFWLLALGMTAVFYLAPLEFLYLRAGHIQAPWLELAGAGLAIMGGLLFLWARRSRMEQLARPAGPYRLLRHPAYAGYLLAGLGLALGYASVWGIAALVMVLLPAVLWRIRVEEMLLQAKYGTEFAKYASRTNKLIPGVW